MRFNRTNLALEKDDTNRFLPWLIAFMTFLAALSVAEAVAAGPFEYVAMPMAIFWNISLFDEWPDPISWLGIFFIAGAGFFIFYQESLRGKEIASERAISRNR